MFALLNRLSVRNRIWTIVAIFIGSIVLMVLKNALFKPLTLARYAIFYGISPQMRHVSWFVRLFHPILHSAGATIPPKSGE